MFRMLIMNMIGIGSRLRSARQARGLAQDELARLAGGGRTSLSQLENGSIGEIGIRKVLRICALLGLELQVMPEGRLPTLDDLLAGRGRR
ncbi:MAG: helix-turn-helix domain-containing protein [Rhodocyclaceae bacterium]|nr:helix-turn-helix domain-containing protein [Thauera sp.]MCP5223558.1 helix-turn-helix domain-containing protein [Thauera sp.]RTL30504.1 MAG: helix-turn-helix domain-containing protein [Rhodocyclaceae bacterium]